MVWCNIFVKFHFQNITKKCSRWLTNVQLCKYRRWCGICYSCYTNPSTTTLLTTSLVCVCSFLSYFEVGGLQLSILFLIFFFFLHCIALCSLYFFPATTVCLVVESFEVHYDWYNPVYKIRSRCARYHSPQRGYVCFLLCSSHVENEYLVSAF